MAKDAEGLPTDLGSPPKRQRLHVVEIQAPMGLPLMAQQPSKVVLPPISQLLNDLEQFGCQSRGLKRSREEISQSEWTSEESAEANSLINNLLLKAEKKVRNAECFAAIAYHNLALAQEECSQIQRLLCFYNRGFCYLMRGNFAEAVSDYQTLIDDPLFPDELKIKAFINRIYGLFGQGKYTEALQGCNTILKDDKWFRDGKYQKEKDSIAKIYNSRGAVQLKLGKHLEAFIDFREVYKMIAQASTPEERQKLWTAELHYNTAQCFFKRGFYDQAVLACKVAARCQGVSEKFRQKLMDMIQEINMAKLQAGRTFQSPPVAR